MFYIRPHAALQQINRRALSSMKCYFLLLLMLTDADRMFFFVYTYGGRRINNFTASNVGRIARILLAFICVYICVNLLREAARRRGGRRRAKFSYVNIFFRSSIFSFSAYLYRYVFFFYCYSYMHSI